MSDRAVEVVFGRIDTTICTTDIAAFFCEVPNDSERSVSCPLGALFRARKAIAGRSALAGRRLLGRDDEKHGADSDDDGHEDPDGLHKEAAADEGHAAEHVLLGPKEGHSGSDESQQARSKVDDSDLIQREQLFSSSCSRSKWYPSSALIERTGIAYRCSSELV